MAVPAVIEPLNEGEISLYGKRYYIKGDIQKSKASAFPQPIRIGDPTRADQQIASETIWTDFTGGMGVIDMDERENPDRFADSSLLTLIKNQVSLLPFRITVTTVGAALPTTIYGAAEYGGYIYIGGGSYIKRIKRLTMAMEGYDTVGPQWETTTGAIATEFTNGASGSVQSKPIVWKGHIWYAFGSGGLVKVNGSTGAVSTITASANPPNISIIPKFLYIFDEDLVMVMTDGSVYSTDQASSSTPAVTYRGGIDTFTAINNVVVWRNAAGEPTPWSVTDRGLSVHDYWNERTYDSGIQFSDNDISVGKGFGVWDGDLWYGKGSNVYQVVNGARIIRGPNTGDGILSDKQGIISALDTSYDNYLIASMDGNESNISSIIAYNRKGWHTIALSLARYTIREYAREGFDGAGSSISLTTDDLGNTWTADTGVIGQAYGRAYTVTLSGGLAITTMPIQRSGSNASDYIVKCSKMSNNASLVFRFQDTSNYYYVKYTTAGGYDLRYVDAGVDASIATYTTVRSVNSDQVSVYCNGSTIRVRINGTLAISATATTLTTAFRCGIRAESVASGFDDYAVIPLSEKITYVHRSASSDLGNSFLLFNEGATVRYLSLPDLTDNPRQYSNLLFEIAGDLITPWMDASLSEIQKTFTNARIVAAGVSSAYGVLPVAYKLRVYYQTDLNDKTSWTQLYDSSGVAISIISDGATDMYYDTDKLGNLYYSIRYKIVFESDVGDGGSFAFTPIVPILKSRFIKELPVLYSYTNLTIDLSKIQPDGTTPVEALTNLENAVEGRLMGRFSYRSGQTSDTQTVIILNYGGPRKTGLNRDSSATITLVEVEPQ